MAKTKLLICPYCGDAQAAGERCRLCGGFFEPLSRQASHNAMGPWFTRDELRPFQPGCSYETLVRLIERGTVTKLTIIRGPTTKQFWTVARRVPGIAHLLGYCHQCDASVDPGDHGCHSCGAPFGAYLDRNYLGLPEVRPLPWEAEVARDNENDLTTGPRIDAPDELRVAVPTYSAAGRISSFVTDEELLGQPERGQPQAASVVAQGASTDSAHVAALGQRDMNGVGNAGGAAGITHGAQLMDAPGTSAATDALESSRVRTLTRRMREQQRMARVFGIALAVSTVVVIVLVVMLIRNGNVTVNAGGTSNTNAELAPPVSEMEKPATGGKALGNGASSPAAAPIDAAASAETNEEPSAGLTPSMDPDQLSAMLAEADALIASAQDDSRDLRSRITDYESALEILRSIDTSLPGGPQRPADLTARITQLEREAERLRMREFFP